MPRLRVCLLYLLVGLATLSLGTQPTYPQAADDTGRPSAEAPGTSDRVLRVATTLDLPLAETWALFANGEAYRLMGVAHFEADFRIGGTIRTHYDPNAEIGDPGTIVHHILSYEPLRMFSSRFEVPEAFPQLALAAQTWGVTRFEPVGTGRTRLISTMIGWGEGPEWDRVYRYFEAGNRQSFERLRTHFASRGEALRRQAEALQERLGRFAGEWTTSSPHGLTTRMSVWKAPANVSVMVQRSRIGGEAEFVHQLTVYHDPSGDALRVLRAGRDGVAHGWVESARDNDTSIVLVLSADANENGNAEGAAGAHTRIRWELTDDGNLRQVYVPDRSEHTRDPGAGVTTFRRVND